MLSEPKPRLSHPRIEAEITHKLLRRGKASDVADRGDEACRHRHIYACNGQKPFYRWVFETTLSNLAIKELDILGKSIEFAEVSVDRLRSHRPEELGALTRLDRDGRKDRQ